MKLRSRIALLLAFVISVVAIPMGFSSWVFGSKDASTSVNKSTDYVCYIDENVAANRYPTIESALDKAVNGNSVYVVPGNSSTVYTITEDCTVKTGVSLVMPYSGKTYKNSDASGSSKGFAKENQRVSKVVVSNGVTITMESGSFLNIGGILGYDSYELSGNVTGSYCEIMLNPDAKIDCYGTINCFGYITESYDCNGSNVTIHDGGYLKSPFVIYDFKGGATSFYMLKADNKFSPFAIYDLPNIQSSLRINSGAIYVGYVKVAVNSEFIESEIPLVGLSDSLFNLTEGFFEIQYHNGDVDRIQSNSALATDNSYSDFFLTGNLYIGSFSVTMSMMGFSIDIDSNDFHLPFSFKNKVTIKEGSTASVDKDIKFMPGSSLTIEKGAVFNVTSEMAFYSGGFVDSSPVSPYPSGKGNARLIINGMLNLSSNAKVGGTVETAAVNAKFNNLSTSTSVTTYEVAEGTTQPSTTDLISIALGWKTCPTKTVTSSLTGLITTSSSINPSSSSFATKNYIAIANPNASDTANTHCWIINTSTELQVIFININSGVSGRAQSATYSLAPVLNPTSYSGSLTYKWMITSGQDGGYFGSDGVTESTASSVSLTTKANTDYEANKYVSVMLVATDENGKEFIATGTYVRHRAQHVVTINSATSWGHNRGNVNGATSGNLYIDNNATISIVLIKKTTAWYNRHTNSCAISGTFTVLTINGEEVTSSNTSFTNNDTSSDMEIIIQVRSNLTITFSG